MVQVQEQATKMDFIATDCSRSAEKMMNAKR